MIRIAIVVGSTRPGRRTEVAARWVADVAARHPSVAAGQAKFETVDLAEQGLPLLDEGVPALFGEYANEHTRLWAETVAGYDGFVFVTPEYNHSVPAALKNAIDFLHEEWHHKAAGFVGHGVHGGAHAVAHLREVMGEVMIADVRTYVALSAFNDFALEGPTDPGVISPGDHQEPTLMEMLDEILAWSRALAVLRGPARVEAPV